MTQHTADLSDAFPEETSWCHIAWQSFGGRAIFQGPVRTVRLFEDNVALREAIEKALPGEILVADGGGSRRCALFGGSMALRARERQIAGLIIYGAVRDVDELARLDLGVLALGACPVRSRKEGGGSLDVPVSFGGIEWSPGQWAYVDRDGVLVGSRELSVGRLPNG